MSFPTVQNSDTCEECGGKCCKYMVLETHKGNDYKIDFWKAVGNEKISETDTHVIYLQKTPCQHSQEDGKCGIYEDRPRLCREFPLRNLPRLWKMVCPLFHELYSEDNKILKVF